MEKRFGGDAFAPVREVEGFERDPALIPAPAQHFEHGTEIVPAGAAVAPVELVDMDVADQVEVTVDQRGVRLSLVDRVVYVEHGADRRARDLADNARSEERRVGE